MESKNILVSLVAAFALVILASAYVSAGSFGYLPSVKVNDIEFMPDSKVNLAVFAGQELDIQVVFVATNTTEDVITFARLRGAGHVYESTERYDVIAGNTYTKTLHLTMPSDIDPSEDLGLLIGVESEHDALEGGHREIKLEIQREAYALQLVSVFSPDQINAGDTLALDVVLRNLGRHDADRAYVQATIPELGITNTVYFGDLTPEDMGGDVKDTEDTRERNVYLAIPANVPAGVYTVEVKAYNTDSTVTQTKRIVVVPSTSVGQVISSTTSKSFGLGDTARYSITLVNTGNSVKIYDLSIDAPSALSVNAEDSIVVVPAGSSKTVNFDVVASEKGNYDFTVSVKSDGQLVSQKSFSAVVNGNKTTGVNASVILTVVLAIIFIVLVIVLIVLLTRKPMKTEEFGESYY